MKDENFVVFLGNIDMCHEDKRIGKVVGLFHYCLRIPSYNLRIEYSVPWLTRSEG